MMNTQEYKDASQGPEGLRAHMVKEMVYHFRSAAEKILLGESEGIMESVVRQKIERKKQLLPERMRVGQ
jgi:hypothetical protein